MGNIVLLDDLTINKIAAGEVIERPASAVKEMLENSIDAGATNIILEIKNGGISYIRITDNGKGIANDDLDMAFERHATSKIRSADDLIKVKSMGFRGEALASISAISKVEMISKTAEEQNGYKIVVEGGKILEKTETGAPIGTTIIVKDLFFNTPVRYKFLRKDFTEAGYIEDAVSRIALSHPEVAIKLINSGRTVIQTNGSGDLKNVIYSIYGKDVANSIIDVNYILDDIHIYGIIGKPEIARSNRANQIFFINKRYVKDKTLTSAVEKAYKDMIPFGKFAFVVLNIDMNPSKVDVNVHPAKLEVRFEDENTIFKAVYHAIKENITKEEVNIFEKAENIELNSKETIIPQDSKSNVLFNNTESLISQNSKNNILFDNAEPAISQENKINTLFNNVKPVITEDDKNIGNKENVTEKQFITESVRIENKSNNESKIIENETILRSQEVLKKLQEMKEKMLKENELISQEIDGKPLQENQLISQEIEEKILPENQPIPQEIKEKDLLENQPISQEIKEKSLQENQPISKEIEEKLPIEKEQVQYETKEELQKQTDEKSNNISKFENIDNKENVGIIEDIFNSRLDEENTNYNGTNYSKDFEDMYMKMFGTKPIKEETQDSEMAKKQNESEELNDIINNTENVSIFDGNPETQKIDYKFIGIVFDKYVIFEMKNEIYFLDIYLAQERILYKSIKDNISDKNTINSQLLLIPDVITLSRKEMEIVKDNTDIFKKIGFIYDEFGENTIKLTEVPEICADLETQDLFLEILSKINSIARTQKTEIEEKIIQIIAENVIKNYEVLKDDDEIKTLIDRILSLKNPFTTESGESIAMKITKYDIERKFARK